jgi:ribosomal protein L31
MADLPPRTPVVPVAGLDRAAVGRAAVALLDDLPGAVLVHHDVGQLGQGVVVRTVRGSGPRGRQERTAVELAHGCVSCTLRLDLLPLLAGLAARDDVSRIVLQLDPALEPEHLCWAVEHVLLDGDGAGTAGDAVAVEAVLGVVDAATWLADATGEDDLQDRALYRTRSTVATDQTIELDGQTLPLVVVDISAASHPFWTGNQRVLDTAGRVERFNQRYGRRARG